MANHILIYSHGFGVRKDDRGLFTDIASGIPDAEHIMFDYSKVDEAANTLTVTPLTEQAKLLRQKIADAQSANPDATVDLVCHSQGCIVAAMANAPGVRKTIFTAPPPDADLESKIKRWQVRYGTEFTTEGTSYLARKDGSTTIVPAEYWTSLEGLDVPALYNTLAKNTDLLIVTATEDEILGEVVLDRLDPSIRVIKMVAGHNFEGEARGRLALIISRIFS